MAKQTGIEFAFFKFLRQFYLDSKGKIRNNYRAITLKFLDYNDREKNPNAFLRRPQFEALEMYVFIKEFMDNRQMYQMFDEWSKRDGVFSNRYYYDEQDQITLFDIYSPRQYHDYFNQIRKYAEKYPNYIYALTMGLGKTILIATCIYYEFLLASRFPRDKRYCHNALVFAPDKTVLQSLKEIVTFDKSKVIPLEYVGALDANIKVHFLDDAGTTLNTLDNSDYNIIISNTQKIILKKQHKEKTAAEKLFSDGISGQGVLGEVLGMLEDISNDKELVSNQRFEKLTRLKQIGIYVDEAHHMFGADLEKALYDKKRATSLRLTISELAEELERNGSNVVACYNYTGTPYVNNRLLPEVVYAYGLNEAIQNNFLKDTDVYGYENVKNEEFLKSVIEDFWKKYGGREYEGLAPKLAIFGAEIKEIEEEIRPTVEGILADLGIPLDKILVNVGNEKLTKAEDLRDFNNLDVEGTLGSKKQFILLVNKGREGWNCRSLFGVALFRSPKSKIFVLQATMRCMRKITDQQQRATVYLSKSNMDILNEELKKNFRTTIEELKGKAPTSKEPYHVRVMEPPRKLKMKKIHYEYKIEENEFSGIMDFDLESIEADVYDARIYVKEGLANETVVKEANANYMVNRKVYSEITLIAEIARYFPTLRCTQISKLLRNSKDGMPFILLCVNEHNEVLDEVIIPKIFDALYTVTRKKVKEDIEVELLRKPKKGGCYELQGTEEMTIKMDSPDTVVRDNREKSFHADTYIFDSKPEKKLFLDLLKNKKVLEAYFTGMFTSDQTDFSVPYIDPESHRLRKYYPDFLVKLDDGSYLILEVKADYMTEDPTVEAKEAAAKDIATESKMEYRMLKASEIMKGKIEI